MANYKAHMALGLLLWIFFAFSFLELSFESLPLASASFFVALLGSVLPDTDTPKSKIGRFLQYGVFFFAFFISFSTFYSKNALYQSFFKSGVVAGIIFIVFVLLRPGHRGITHSLKVNVVYGLGVFVWLFPSFGMVTAGYIAFLGAACYFSHLVLDEQIKF